MNEKLKILQVLPEINSGGVERGTLELGKYLVNSKFESHVISNGGRMLKQLEQEGSIHHCFPVHCKSLLTLLLAIPIRKLLLKESFDIIHVRSRMPAWVIYIAWKLLPKNKRPKLVSTFHGFYSINYYSQIMALSEGIVCVSESVKNYVLSNYPVARGKQIEVINRGVNTTYYNPEFQASTKWLNKWKLDYQYLESKFIVTLPGRLTHWKGHNDALDIVYDLKKEKIPIHALFVGDLNTKKRKYYKRILKKITTLDLKKEVTILKHRDDLMEIMSESDLILSCSQEPEAFGRVTLEALSLGVPVIGYSHGGVKEQLETLFSYGMIEAKKKSSMKLKIKEFYKLKNKPRPNINKKFTLEQTNEKLISFYFKILSK